MTTCRGCGKRIVWGVSPEGKWIPLDPTPPTYRVDLSTDPPTAWRANGEPGADDQVLVSHFATCPKASEFSGGGR